MTTVLQEKGRKQKTTTRSFNRHHEDPSPTVLKTNFHHSFPHTLPYRLFAYRILHLEQDFYVLNSGCTARSALRDRQMTFNPTPLPFLTHRLSLFRRFFNRFIPRSNPRPASLFLTDGALFAHHHIWVHVFTSVAWCGEHLSFIRDFTNPRSLCGTGAGASTLYRKPIFPGVAWFQHGTHQRTVLFVYQQLHLTTPLATSPHNRQGPQDPLYALIPI